MPLAIRDNLITAFSIVRIQHVIKISFHKISVPLRKVVVYVLLEPQLCGVRCTFDPLIASLNYLGGGVGKDAYATVTCEPYGGVLYHARGPIRTQTGGSVNIFAKMPILA